MKRKNVKNKKLDPTIQMSNGDTWEQAGRVRLSLKRGASKPLCRHCFSVLGPPKAIFPG